MEQFNHLHPAQEKIDLILDQLMRIQAMENDLWGITEIGRYLKCSSTKTRRVVLISGFPRPVKLPTTDKGSHPRWYSNEVKTWVRKWKT